MQVDILSPYVELKWKKCRSLPVSMSNAQAVWMGDKLYVRRRKTLAKRDAARLYIYTPKTDTWISINTPVLDFALVTYRSQLVLVGGKEYINGREGSVTNKLWTLTEHSQWRETLPSMATNRCGASAVEFADNIVVAGGVVDDIGSKTDIVEVYNSHHWAEARCLLESLYRARSAVLNGHWYLMGGCKQDDEVYSASLESLVASCKLHKKPATGKKLPAMPTTRSSAAVFGNRVIAVGGDVNSSSIHAYSPQTQTWECVGDMPVGLRCSCTAILPTGELMVIGGQHVAGVVLLDTCVYKASLNGKTYSGLIVKALLISPQHICKG